MQPSDFLHKGRKQTTQLEQTKQQLQAEIEKRKQSEAALLKAQTQLEQYEAQVAELTQEKARLCRHLETLRASQANNTSVKTEESLNRQIREAKHSLMTLQQSASNPLKELLAEAIAQSLVALEELHLATKALFSTRQELERERQHYQELFEFAPDGYLVTDNGGIIQEANSAAATLLNVRQEFLVGKSLVKFVAQADRQAFHSCLGQFNRCRKQKLSMQPRGGKPFLAAVTVSAIGTPQGKSVGWRWLIRDITNYQRAEQALRQSKERLRLLVESVEDYAIFMLAPDGRIISWNAGAERIKGYRAEEIIGRHFQCFYQAEDVQQGLPEQGLKRAKANGRFEREGWRVRKDGTLFWANVVITALWDQTGKLRGFAKVTRDISDRKQAEEALRQQTEALLSFSTNLKHLHRIATTRYQNFEALLTDYLKAGSEILTLSTGIISQISGQTYIIRSVQSDLDLAPGLEFPLENTYCARVANEKRTITYTHVSAIPQMQGHPVYQNLGLETYIGAPIFVDGKVYGTLNFSSTEPRSTDFAAHELEIVELMAQSIGQLIRARQAEKERREAEDSLRLTQHLLEKITDTSPCLIFILDLVKGCQVYINRYTKEFLGGTPKQRQQTIQFITEILHPDDFRQLKTLRKRFATIQNGEVLEQEFRLKNAQEEWRWLHASNVVFTRTAEGMPEQMLGIAIDISDRKRAEEVRLALEKEQELKQLQLRFFSMVSHEFRTPLSTILVSAQILEHSNQEWLNEKVHRNLHRIQTSVKHTLRLLEDILTINRAETGKIEFCPQPLALKQVCHQLVEQVSLNCDRTINLTIKERDIVCLDGKLLRSILSNLLANAIKYSPDGSKIALSVECQSKAVIFLVQDEGIGIPAEDIPNLFDPFYRGKNVGVIAGSGLGLAVVKQCVELHGGKITLDSNVGGGTTFAVVLPI